ncbi:hypothetical protein D3C79_689970 [compost metagenome]
MRHLAAQRRGQAHHYRFSHDQALGHVEVLAHALGAHVQAGQHEARLAQRGAGQGEGFRDGDPLGLPWAGGALEVLDHGVEHQPGLLAHALGGGVHQLAGNRVALLRHGAAGATAFDERLVGFAQLAGHHHHDVQGHLAQRGGYQAEEVQGFRQAVTGHVPGRLRHAQAQLVHQCGLHFQALVTQ